MRLAPFGAVIAAGLAIPVAAQEITEEALPSLETGLGIGQLIITDNTGERLDEYGNIILEDVEEEIIAKVTQGQGAVLRGLDRVSTRVADLDLAVGQSGDFGALSVTLGDCRYPVDNPSGDAYAFLTVRDTLLDTELFSGWMMASSPALNALEHSRYDLWVLRCNTSEADGAEASE